MRSCGRHAGLQTAETTAYDGTASRLPAMPRPACAHARSSRHTARPRMRRAAARPAGGGPGAAQDGRTPHRCKREALRV